jgi:hypothetical protein
VFLEGDPEDARYFFAEDLKDATNKDTLVQQEHAKTVALEASKEAEDVEVGKSKTTSRIMEGLANVVIPY